MHYTTPHKILNKPNLITF
ncbi:hypothetical protein E2C01_079983 [Portunus trituberculatus]|uniref:Uncharacterized protein n=1 Tax=Portunus trituberculatus TaxID=210409 RepID=A0A5B7ISS6_PORTR|nr:hypothetical protein [Portunus trituberculatus]